MNERCAMWSHDNAARVLIMVLLMTKTVRSKEPQCSSFHYEEQLLSKMIRMEIAMEQQQQRVTDVLQNMSESIEEFKKEAIENEKGMLARIRDAIESANATMVKVHNKTMLLDDNLQNAIDGFVEDSKLLSSTLTQNVSETIGRLHALEEKASTPTIAFEAKVLQDMSVSAYTPLVFTEAVFNHGNGYDVKTGVFTCPVNGTYLFTSHVCNYHYKPVYYSLVVDDVVHTDGYIHGSNKYHCTSFQAIAILQVTSRVWVQNGHGSSQFYQTSSLLNTFSGVLLNR